MIREFYEMTSVLQKATLGLGAYRENAFPASKSPEFAQTSAARPSKVQGLPWKLIFSSAKSLLYANPDSFSSAIRNSSVQPNSFSRAIRISSAPPDSFSRAIRNSSAQ